MHWPTLSYLTLNFHPYDSHFTDEETEMLNNLPENIALRRGRDRIGA